MSQTHTHSYQIDTPRGPVTVIGEWRWILAFELADALGGTLTGQLSRGLSAYADAAYEYRGAGQNAFQLTAGLKLAW